MRKWIDICDKTRTELDEGKLKNYAMSVAAGAAAITGAHKGMDQPTDDLIPTYYVYDDEAKGLGISNIDQVDPNVSEKKHSDKKHHDKAKQSSRSVKLLALTMWGEARSDGPQAMRAVGHVVMNRIRSKRKFGTNVEEVVLKRKAFSCWNPSDPNRAKMQDIASLPEDSLERVRWEQAVQIAQRILAGKDSDPTSGAMFYHTKMMGRPYWVTPDMRPDAIIAHHYFYKNDGKAKS